jgi:hypothetical protein
MVVEELCHGEDLNPRSMKINVELIWRSALRGRGVEDQLTMKISSVR